MEGLQSTEMEAAEQVLIMLVAQMASLELAIRTGLLQALTDSGISL